MALIIAAYILTSLRIKRQLMAVLVPFVLVTIELTHTLISAYGDRLIYLFVIGALLTSLPYRSPAGLIGAMVLNLTVTGVFAFILGMNFNSYLFHITLQDEVFNFSGVIALYLAIFLFNHFSLRYLNKHHDVGILFENILENSSSLKVITNDKAKIEHASQSLAEFFNIGKREYAINLPLADLFPTDELKVYFNELFRRKGYISEKFETNIKGEHYWFSLRSVPVDESSIARFFELEDITLLVKSQEEAIRSNHAKSQFLATMSHEIRTPMNAIIGISQIQLQKAGIPGEYADAFDRIYDSGRSLLGIINDILDLSKIETGKMELNPVEYDVPSVVYDVVQLNILRIGGKPVEFLLDIDENLPSKMIGDELRLKQILTNLLSNAIKYTEKGHVKLIISHSMSGEDVTLRFDIEDTGQGMKPEDVKRLFTEYTRFNIDTNRAVEGTGIGLNIANSLAALMDGNITVVSGYGKGSIFTLTVKQKAVTCETIGADLAGRL
ncbi:MAG: ATP-binding protein, partial [Spirochaetes bacterium]|nr:ATP-binding protein [Spirochaetota bacterium]